MIHLEYKLVRVERPACTCPEVTASVRPCTIMDEKSEDCVVCFKCNAHLHVVKGSRKVLPAHPMPWQPITPKGKRNAEEV